MKGMAENVPMDEGGDEPGALSPGMRLGRYELLVAIARGGMARVWAARQHGQRGFTKLVAIKTILPHLAREPEFERMFLDEARIASNVHHPNVCDTYELGEENGVLYLAMEWVNGDSLSRVLRPNSAETQVLDYRVVARIVADACAGLHAAHELCGEDGRPLQVVHRDFSPHNILVSADGNVKVADFGVAKALGQLHENTTAGQIKGKLAYMAPEQVAGIVDRRSDVFSAGCVLYEATCGIAPFRADNDMQIMHNLMSGNYVRPTQRVPTYPAGLDRIVATALAADPKLRFQTAEQLRVALEEWLARSGPVVTQANVAQALRARIGDRIDRRKERIRAAQAASPTADDSQAISSVARSFPGPASGSGVQLRGDLSSPGYGSQPSHPSHLSHPSQVSHLSHASLAGYGPPSVGAGMGPMPPPVADGDGKYNVIGGIAIGAIVAIVLGMGGYFAIVRPRSAPPAQPPVVAAPVTPASAPPAPSAFAGVVPSVGVAVVATPDASLAMELPDTPQIDLELSPPNATVSVDGQPAAALAAVPKPGPGKPVTLTVRAEGREDAVVKVDETTTSPLKITLKWKARAPAAPAIPTSPY
jgi:serine/threonine protein kinase